MRFGSDRNAVRLEKTARGYHLGHQIEEIQVDGAHAMCGVEKCVQGFSGTHGGNRPL
jgi:hypothetical protein